MTDACDNTDHCQGQFDVLFEKIDRLDEALRGNGKVGIMVRLDRLEQTASRQAKLLWILIGATTAGIATVVADLVGGAA